MTILKKAIMGIYLGLCCVTILPVAVVIFAILWLCVPPALKAILQSHPEWWPDYDMEEGEY